MSELFRRIEARGDVYLGEYEDWYCTPCETFWPESQLLEGNCPDCHRPTERLKEPSYFFRMSRHQDALLRHIEENPEFIQPVSRRNEIVSFIREGLRDLSISRTSFSWGIPVPADPRHVVYVWFDALTNYITGVRFPDDAERSWQLLRRMGARAADWIETDSLAEVWAVRILCAARPRAVPWV